VCSARVQDILKFYSVSFNWFFFKALLANKTLNGWTAEVVEDISLN